MKTYSLNRIVLLVFIQFFVLKQVNAQAPRYLNDPIYLTYFNTLRQGNLLVGLSDRAGIRAKLVQYGETEELRKFDAALHDEFDEIFQAFKKQYSFGAVYFYLKSEQNLLGTDKFSTMQFYDAQGQKVNPEQINGQLFLFGEFSRMERKTRGPLIVSKDEASKTNTKTSFSAFVIRDQENKIINKSYYLFVRTILRSKASTIKKLNKRLERNLVFLK